MYIMYIFVYIYIYIIYIIYVYIIHTRLHIHYTKHQHDSLALGAKPEEALVFAHTGPVEFALPEALPGIGVIARAL